MSERIPIQSTEQPSEKWNFFYRIFTKLSDKDLLDIQGGLLGQPTSKEIQRVLDQHPSERHDLMKEVIDRIIDERLRSSTRIVDGKRIEDDQSYRFET
jgi:hypothetical protein